MRNDFLQSIHFQSQRQFVVSRDMPRDVFLDAASLRYGLNAVFTIIVAWNGQEFSVGRHIAVLLDDMLGDVQQSDIRFDTRFLTLGIQPQMSVERSLQVRFGKVRHIRPTQSRKDAEDEQITNQFIAFLLECTID